MALRLQFAPFQSQISPSFWHRLTHVKLHELKLSDEPIAISATYTTGSAVKDRLTGSSVSLGNYIELDESSFDQSTPSSPGRAVLKGELRNFNTIADFRDADKNAILIEAGDRLWTAMQAGAALEDLNSFVIVTFADLKRYRYFYWCAFPAFLQKPGWEIERDWTTTTISEAPTRSLTLDEALEVPTLTVLDPSVNETAAGWPVRNALTYLAAFKQAMQVMQVRLVLYRGADIPSRTVTVRVASAPSRDQRPSVVGWERDDKGELKGRVADLAPMMDPARLANQAVDLNLQLMRWRILPSLDLDRVKNTRCLLLGAGTLGCYVARTLMAWGVRNITLVDSATVSFSNPVRQPLFDFEDSLGGGKPKAETAAAALRKIYPGVNARGVKLSIPMPGHPVPEGSEAQVKRDIEQLEQLVSEHDVVWLLMDSRESRWLPTVIGGAQRKLVMNVALGFDTYLAMRHGIEGALGCYYCNDVVAPTDSLKDLTLDQMCTVTRPGIAAIASATAVELMVSTIQHPQGSAAPSETSSDDSTASPLGIVPHQLRGFLARFETLKITGQAYDKCTGCSSKVLEAYAQSKDEMLFAAFKDAKSLERLTGLDKMYEESEKAMQAMEEADDWGEEDDF